ncbi:MAG TPA: DUF1846 domain-containing protein [Candidatus Dojkabacteria bacterium]|nr:DUF1846 domain-containing protein [Candidatus Dojkabacteria bacterium]
MNSTDVIEYKKTGFDSKKYIELQSQAIEERVKKFSKGKLYLEIGGKFLFDPHAQRVLPGFNPYSKVLIFKNINIDFDLIFCINAQDIVSNRMLSNKWISYMDYILKMLKDFEATLGKKPQLSINLISKENENLIESAITQLDRLGYKIYKRYKIDGYPQSNKVLSKQGYGKDDYIHTDNNLVLVVGAASNSGKMSTCLGQIYLDSLNGKDSGYAKYETFPIWNLELNHPINLAYEAATIDIGDYNVMDKYHKENYGIDSVNYNRDVDAFIIVKELAEQFLPKDNFVRAYKSPTDMGISKAGFAITDDKVVSIAAYREILRRKGWYTQVISRGEGSSKWITQIEKLEAKAMKYIEDHDYDINMTI